MREHILASILIMLLLASLPGLVQYGHHYVSSDTVHGGMDDNISGTRAEPNLIGEWRFDEASGNTAGDSSGNGYQGTLWNMDNSDWTDGKRGNALDFDGVNDYVSIDQKDVLDNENEGSLCLWIYPRQVGGIFFAYNTYQSNDAGCAFYIQNDGKLIFSYKKTDLTGNLLSNKILTVNNWYHVVLTSDGIGNTLHINGVKDTYTKQGVWTDGAWFNDINQIGIHDHYIHLGHYFRAQANPGNSYFDGIIDEMVIYDRALTEVEVQRQYKETGPVAHWSFDEGTGNKAGDRSGNGNNGTLHNMDGNDWVRGIKGKALNFDGVDDYVSIDQKDILDNENEGSICFWIYPRQVGGTFFSYNTYQSNNAGSSFSLLNDGKLSFSYKKTDLTGSITSSKILAVDNWFHIVFTSDGIGNTLFVNGKNETYTEHGVWTDGVWFNDINQIGIHDHYVHIGHNFRAQSNPGTYYYNGIIDEVSIYNRSLSAKEIREHYNNTAEKIYDLAIDSKDITLSDPEPMIGDNIRINATIRNIGKEGIIFKDGFEEENKWGFEQTSGGSYSLSLSTDENNTGSKSLEMTGDDYLQANGYARISRDIDLTGIEKITFAFKNGQAVMNGARSLAYWVNNSRTTVADVSTYNNDRWFVHEIDTGLYEGNQTVSIGIFKSGGYAFSDLTFFFDTVLGYEGLDATVTFFDGNPDSGGSALGSRKIVFSGEESITSSVEWTATEGRHDIHVSIGEVIPEDENPDNNIASIKIIIPSLVPDLSINGTDIFYSNSEPREGETITVSAMGRNVGGDHYYPWWTADWQYRKIINVDNTGNPSPLHDIPLSFRVPYDSNMKNDFQDVRFTDTDGNELKYWMESVVEGSHADVWVKVESIPGSNSSHIIMYYGNDEAPTRSRAENVFEAYDDFDDNELDMDYWNVSKQGGVDHSVSNGILDLKLLSASLGDHVRVRTKDCYAGPLLWETRIKTTSAISTGQYAPASGLRSYVNDKHSCLFVYHNSVQTNNGSGNNLDTINDHPITNTWKEIKMIWLEDFVDYYVDDVLVKHFTEYIPQEPMSAFFTISCDQVAGSSNKVLSIDWIKVRRYTSVLPIISIKDESELFTARMSFYDGDPDEGGSLIDAVNITSWNEGEKNYTINWTPLESGEHDIFVKFDDVRPADADAENNVATRTINVLPGEEAPHRISSIPDISFPEDTNGTRLINLSEYFNDINEPISPLSFSLYSMTNGSNIEAELDGYFISFFSSKENWYGNERFRVNCSNDLGLFTCSNVFNVTVTPVNDPPRVQLIYPVNGNDITSMNVTLSWFVADVDDNIGNLTFDLYLDNKYPPRVHSSDITSSEVNVTFNVILEDRTTYHWYVKPHDREDTGICINGTWNFTVNTSTPVPEAVLASPQNGDIINITSVNLTWTVVNPLNEVPEFEIYLGESKDELERIDTTPTEFYLLDDLKDNTTYHWMIVPVCESMRGRSKSGTWSFTIRKDFIYDYSLSWSVNKKMLSVKKGDGVLSFDLTVENTGNNVNSISISVKGELENKVSFSSTTFDLQPEEDDTTRVTIITSQLNVGKHILVLQLHHSGGVKTIELPINVTGVETDISSPDKGFGDNIVSISLGIVLVTVIVIVILIIVKKKRKKREEGNEFEDVESDAIDADIVHVPKPGQAAGYVPPQIEKPPTEIDNFQDPLYQMKGREYGPMGIEHFTVTPSPGDAGTESGTVTPDTAAKDSPGIDVSGLHLPDESDLENFPIDIKQDYLALPPARYLDVKEEQQKVPIDELFLMTPDGLLIQHYSLRRESGLNEDVLASMLSAVKSFISDSLSMLDKGANTGKRDVNRIDFGEYSVMMASGSSLALVAISAHEKKEIVLEQIKKGVDVLEGKFGHIMANWDGDMTKVEGVKPYIESLVKGEFDPSLISDVVGKDHRGIPPLPGPADEKPELPSGVKTVTIALPDPVKLPDTRRALPEKSVVGQESAEPGTSEKDILSALDDILGGSVEKPPAPPPMPHPPQLKTPPEVPSLPPMNHPQMDLRMQEEPDPEIVIVDAKNENPLPPPPM